MKKFFISLSMVACMISAIAKPILLIKHNPQHSYHKAEVPAVDQDGDVITISTDSVTEADVYIKDECGNILTASSLVLSPAGDQIIVPEEYQEDMFTIEVHTEDDTFTGYINN